MTYAMFFALIAIGTGLLCFIGWLTDRYAPEEQAQGRQEIDTLEEMWQRRA